MSVPGGGDITELLRRLGPDALVHEGEQAELHPRNNRMQCPWIGCQGKGPSRKLTAAVVAEGGHARVRCYSCNGSGDLLDLLQRTRGLSSAEAIAHVQGSPVPERPKPALRVVGSRPPDDAGKLLPAEVQRIWDSLATTSDLCRPYLVKRSLVGAIDAGLVRFTTEDSKNKEIAQHAAKNRRIAVLLSDVVGNARGIQLRVAGEPRGKDPKVLSVKGSVTSRAFFGQPGEIDRAAVIAVAEGMADTLALQLWAEKGAVVVGAAGMSFLPRLAEELELADVDITGKLFAIFPQNDDKRAPNSKSMFRQLQQLLVARGARVCRIETPAIHKDVADWRNSAPTMEWPPPKLAEYFEHEPGDDSEPLHVLPRGMALPMPARVEAKTFAQNYTTLVHLIDDVSSRETIFHTRDPLIWCEMTGQPKVGGRELTEDDVSTVRLGLESQARSTDGKPLQFKETDIQKAIAYVARRNPVHEIRDDVEAFAPWDEKKRIETELPGILGHAAWSFEGRLLLRWFVSTIARVMKPGCQVDTVLILQGGQGASKTNFFRRLGGKWTTSSKVQPGDDEGMMVMRQFWLIEWGELSSMKARSREVTKDFITNPVDTFRWPWGRRPVSAPRHAVIVGTTNDKQILEDPTGNRRYWPIEVRVEDIDLVWLERNREQLFAEAIAIYRAGEACSVCSADAQKRCGDHRWWLTKEEELLLKQHQQDFEVDAHPWFDVLHDWIEKTNPTSLTTAQILKHGLEVDVEHFKEISSNQIAQLMERLEWKKTRRDGGVRGPRIWVRKDGLL